MKQCMEVGRLDSAPGPTPGDFFACNRGAGEFERLDMSLYNVTILPAVSLIQ